MTKKTIVIILIVVGLGVAFFATKPSPSQLFSNLPLSLEKVTPTTSPSLPEGWKYESKVSDTQYKLTKPSSTDKVVPTIISTEEKFTSTLSPSDYTDRLIKGAKSTIRNLTYSVNKSETSDTLYTRFLRGTYQNGKNKVALIQKITIANGQLIVTTASYQADTADTKLAAEIDAILGR